MSRKGQQVRPIHRIEPGLSASDWRRAFKEGGRAGLSKPLVDGAAVEGVAGIYKCRKLGMALGVMEGGGLDRMPDAE